MTLLWGFVPLVVAFLLLLMLALNPVVVPLFRGLLSRSARRAAAAAQFKYTVLHHAQYVDGSYYYCGANASQLNTPVALPAGHTLSEVHSQSLRATIQRELCPPYVKYAKIHLRPSGPSPDSVSGAPSLPKLQQWLRYKCKLRLKPRRVYDLFMFHNELAQLRIRLEELRPVVYTHILVESSLAFSGKPKPLVYAAHRGEFEQSSSSSSSSIRHYVTDITAEAMAQLQSLACEGGLTDDWLRENLQRQVGVHGLFDASDEDLVLVTDVDEIPSREVVNALRWCEFPQQGVGNLPMNFYYYHLGCMFEGDWAKPTVFTVAFLRSLGRTCETRTRKPTRLTTTPAGWHLSFFGGPERIRLKVQRFAHRELENSMTTSLRWARRASAECLDLFNRGEEALALAADLAFLPHELYAHPDRYAESMPEEVLTLLRACSARAKKAVTECEEGHSCPPSVSSVVLPRNRASGALCGMEDGPQRG